MLARGKHHPGLSHDPYQRAIQVRNSSERNEAGPVPQWLPGQSFLDYFRAYPFPRAALSCANSKPTAVSPQIPKAAPPSDFKVPLLIEGLRLSDFAAWSPILQSKKNWPTYPASSRTPPTTATRDRADRGLDRPYPSTLYFVFHLLRSHPSGPIRSHLARREDISGDDNVSVLLDPFEDRPKGSAVQRQSRRRAGRRRVDR